MTMGIDLWQADADWRRIDLISDIHLSDETPRTFEAWKRHLLDSPADAVLMLGDVFEVWVGDDARLDGFERACLQVLQAAAATKFLAFMAGNRDFLLGVDMLREAGIRHLTDPTLARAFGQDALLSHGDALCVTDAPYQTFRALVRTANWQASFLAMPLNERRARARAMRGASVDHQASMAPGAWVDVDESAACDWLASADCGVLIHGHTHRPGQRDLPGHRSRRVLGDWQFDVQPHRARILQWTAEGLTDIDLAAQ